MVYKCKMCGGSLKFNKGETICTCEYCGTKQTLPKLDSEKKKSLLDRADSFRRNNDYDKASVIYEQILVDEKIDSEVYWLNTLCRYGIEYVEDPRTKRRIPTINRVQYDSILKDKDYLKAIELANPDQKEIYKQEATYINKIQSQILEISNKEEPFDIFICYKETDDNGRRTEDSVLAQDIYKELTNEGYKVFFSRITLEDKLGTAYEPYIFAALNSAKVMLVIGTKKEHFEAVWVKNEWSRYLSLIKSGQKKLLIPCYKNMDPYDLPEEFSYLQAQDLNKLGFMQDLTRGIYKILVKNEETNIRRNTTMNNDHVKQRIKRVGGNLAKTAIILLIFGIIFSLFFNYLSSNEKNENKKREISYFIDQLKCSDFDGFEYFHGIDEFKEDLNTYMINSNPSISSSDLSNDELEYCYYLYLKNRFDEPIDYGALNDLGYYLFFYSLQVDLQQREDLAKVYLKDSLKDDLDNDMIKFINNNIYTNEFGFNLINSLNHDRRYDRGVLCNISAFDYTYETDRKFKETWDQIENDYYNEIELGYLFSYDTVCKVLHLFDSDYGSFGQDMIDEIYYKTTE